MKHNSGIHVLSGNEECAHSVAEGNLGYIIAALYRLPQTVNNIAATAKHLQQGHVRAILDVSEEKPFPVNSPLHGLENAILIPRLGSPTTERRAAVMTHL